MTVLVIDDQIHVVVGILSEVSWENLGVDKVWKAYNAVEAKGILLLNKVDIMLCDIEMPGENGLSLLKWTQDQGMEVECIFLTAHADFVYARTAMQLGSFDYILQPARYEDIGNAILRAKQRIQEKREQQKFYSYGKTLFEERDRITDQLFREWYQEPENGERYRKLLEDMQKMGRHICDSSPCFLILCQILRWNNAPWERDLFRYSCANILEELFQEWNRKVYIGCLSHEEFIFLVYGEDGKQPDKEETRRQLEHFFNTASRFFCCEQALYVSGTGMFRTMPEKLEVIRHKNKDNVARKPGIYEEEEKKETKADHILQPDFRTWETLLVRGMGKTVYEEACRYLQELADAEALNAESLQKFYNDFYRIICLTEEKTDTSWEDIFPEEQQRQTALHAYETLQNMQVFLKIVTSYFAEEEEDAGRAGGQVEAIKEYIYHHLDSDIRREDIAVQVFMNPNYVSRLFKKVEGISLKEFIVREKMKMARALLISSQLPVSIVALKVGYSNFSHFSQVYRKTFGVSPTDERKKQEE